MCEGQITIEGHIPPELVVIRLCPRCRDVDEADSATSITDEDSATVHESRLAGDAPPSSI